ncbi:hypothetical protein HO173_004490 [Letharia columbiana]|uniref:Uncharacterized protein n=1 Tax=Letharia columbiana TaxID=112416 RepID=A0A8H6FZL8_9LECA|nr:uncharacterized protein HO173_004490 [Letharia columbiana]KAF6237600.1 hypothetical protein HO173_004490 [Letharia columbiana]
MCKKIYTSYEPNMLMIPQWTIAKEIEWSNEAATEYFFETGTIILKSTANLQKYVEKILKAWELRGQRVEKVEPVLEKAMTDEYGNEKRGLEGNKHATYVIARK